MSVITDSGFVSFEVNLEDTLMLALKMALTLNNTRKATEENVGLQDFKPAVLFLSEQATTLYNDLCLSLTPWDLTAFDSSDKASEARQKSEQASFILDRKVHNEILQTYSSKNTTKAGRTTRDTKIRRATDKELRIMKRQASILLAGAGLVAGGAWLMHATHLDTLLGLKDDSEDHLQVKLEEVAHQLNSEEDSIKELHKTMSSLMRVETKIVSLEHFQELLSTLHFHFAALRIRVNNLIQGLADLLRHHVSPSLISYHALKLGFQTIIDKALSNGLQPIIANAADLYTLEASHLFDKNTFSLFVSIAVPLEDPRDSMELYSYLPFPTAVNTSGSSVPKFILAKPENPFLAVNDQTQTYLELQTSDLLLCHNLGRKYICPKNGVKMGSQNSCLVSLYQGDSQGIFDNCEHTLANRDFILQKNFNSYLIYIHNNKQLDIKCKFSENEHSKTFSKIITLFLPFDCIASLGGTQIQAHSPIMGKNIRIKVTDIEYGLQMPLTFQSHLDQMEREANNSLTHSEKILGDIKHVITDNTTHVHRTNWATLGILLFLGIVTLGCSGYCAYKYKCVWYWPFKSCKLCVKRKSKTTNAENGEELNNLNPANPTDNRSSGQYSTGNP